MPNAILSIGLYPSAVDYSKYPGIDEAMLTARIEAGEAALRTAGFDFVSCQVPADPDDRGEVARPGENARIAPTTFDDWLVADAR